MSMIVKLAARIQDLSERVNALEGADNLTRQLMLKRTQRKFLELKREFDLIGMISLFEVITDRGKVYLGNIQHSDVYHIIHHMDHSTKILEVNPLETKTFLVLSGEKTP